MCSLRCHKTTKQLLCLDNLSMLEKLADKAKALVTCGTSISVGTVFTISKYAVAKLTENVDLFTCARQQKEEEAEANKNADWCECKFAIRVHSTCGQSKILGTH